MTRSGLDHASAEALLFAARRLHAEQIAVLVAVRDEETNSFPATGLPDLRLTGLRSGDARQLTVDRLKPGTSADVIDWVVASAQGNPLG